MIRYKLNHNSNRILPGEKNYSIWVGDLSPEIDDLMLYKFFSARFQTIISAKGKSTAHPQPDTSLHSCCDGRCFFFNDLINYV